MIRISGIFEFIDPNHLGFQESEVAERLVEVGFRKSEAADEAAASDS